MGASAKERAEGLAAAARCRRTKLLALAEPLASVARVVEPPTAKTVMMEVATAVGPFCLAEVVVTTASVRIAEAVGWSCVLGWDEHGALAAALCDAVGGAGTDQLAAEALAAETAERREIEAAVATTRVSLA